MRFALAVLLAATCLPSSVAAEYEIDVQDKFCAGMPLNQYLRDGSEVDCIREDVAIEVDFSDHWAAAIGQALHYGAILERRPAALKVTDLMRAEELIAGAAGKRLTYQQTGEAAHA